MFKRFKNIRIPTLIVHLIITLAYPAVKAYISERNRLLIFTDSMTIVGVLLILVGVFFHLYLKGDFDRTAYTLRRGVASSDKIVKPFEDFQKDKNEDREEAFNYPLCLGILYIIISVIVSYCWL